MNVLRESNQDEMRSLLLMHELEAGAPLSQREIAGRLGIALGLVNAYLKTLAHKGFIQIKAYPRNRYAYLLTPSGFAEKSRLAYQQVAYFHTLFRTARQDSFTLFCHLRDQGINELAFCGVDEFTEIAYLSLCEAQIHLRGVFDDRRAGERFVDQTILPLAAVSEHSGCAMVVTALRETESCRDGLLQLGIGAENIYLPISERL